MYEHTVSVSYDVGYDTAGFSALGPHPAAVKVLTGADVI